jgi:hypothetical protein
MANARSTRRLGSTDQLATTHRLGSADCGRPPFRGRSGITATARRGLVLLVDQLAERA